MIFLEPDEDLMHNELIPEDYLQCEIKIEDRNIKTDYSDYESSKSVDNFKEVQIKSGMSIELNKNTFLKKYRITMFYIKNKLF